MKTMDRIIAEFRTAVRTVARNGTLSVLMVLTLALGLGANTTIFSLVKSVLFIEADFGRNTGRLISLHSMHPSRAQQLDDAVLSWPEFESVRTSLKGVDRVEGYVFRNFTLEVEDGAARVSGASVTPGLFNVIDARPAMGRLFTEADARDFGAEGTVILSDALWRRQYGADASIVGRDIVLNRRKVEVIGVMPKGFAFPVRQELWLPYKPATPPANDDRFLQTVALLSKDGSMGSVAAQLAPLSESLERRLPDSQRDYHLKVAAFPGSLIGNVQVGMKAMMLSVLMVLMIACANLAGLLVARGVDRRRELALKSALGASRISLVRELLAEVFVLSVTGAVLGWLFAAWAVPQLVASFRQPPPYWLHFEVDGQAFGYCLALTLLTTVFAGLLPAWRSGSVSAGIDLKDSGRSTTRNRRTRVVQEGIVVAQVAVCLALVVAAQLTIQSFTNLQQASSGVREDGLLTTRLYLSGDEVDAPADKARALGRMIDGLLARPTVMSAGITTSIPADDGGRTAMIVQDVGTPSTEEIPATVVGASEGLFDSMGGGLLRGRALTRQEFEDPKSTSVVVSASLAAALGKGTEVVGKAIALRQGSEHDWRTIVGVAADVQYEEFGEETAAARRALYVPYASIGSRTVAILIRTRGVADPLVRELRTIAKAAHPGIALFDIRTMAQVRQETTWEQSFLAHLMGLFAGAALVLAGIGLYGLLRQFVGARTHEIGVRRALGASGRAIAALVISRAGFVTAVGVAVGGWLSSLVAKGLAGILFGASALSVPTFAVASVAVALLVMVCSWIPVRRAIRVDPLVTLRQE
ncbi:MAG: ADOP family duplicated permease [Vicinamibacteria bacterium]